MSPRVSLTVSAPVSLVVAIALAGSFATTAFAEVRVVQTPDHGIQPQAVVDEKGTLHLIWFKGEAMNGDAFYATRGPDGQFSKPIRVNSQPGSVVATGTIRGAHLAVDGDGRAHVSWMGSGEARPRPKQGAPMLYARMNKAGTAFEPQRNLVTWATGLDGGGSVASDREGNVYVAWHAGPEGQDAGEEARGVFVAHSHDGGRTFAREARADVPGVGACGCCGMRAFADPEGNLALLYRAAHGPDRDMRLLVSNDRGASFKAATLSQWPILTCPMSSATLASSSGKLLAATERDGKVMLNFIDPASPTSGKHIAPPAARRAKHATVAQNARGETLLAWAEGTGWKQGGALVWQTYDAAGKPGRLERLSKGIPVWSLPSAVALPDGDFVLFH